MMNLQYCGWQHSSEYQEGNYNLKVKMLKMKMLEH